MAAGLTLDQVAERMVANGDDAPGRGTLSAIENGHRGASREFLQSLERALRLPDGSISTDYEPRATAAVEISGTSQTSSVTAVGAGASPLQVEAQK